MRYFCTVAYNGTAYHGWQIQKNAISIQEIITTSFSKVLREPLQITASGRTDTGVHAAHQVVHLDTDKKLSNHYLHKFNSILPKDISIKQIREVKLSAHARFDAVQRSYKYHIVQFKDPFLPEGNYLYTRSLDLEIMNQACEVLLKHEDFQCFSRVKTDVNHFLCRISLAIWRKQNELLVFHVSANRFLRGMVRSMVGTLLDVGTGKTNLEEFLSILKSKDRRRAGRSVPARGLILDKVEYPDTIFQV